MKKLVVISALIWLGYKGFQNKKKIENLKEALKITPQNIRNIMFSGGNLQFMTDLQITNTSPLEFSLNSLGAIKIKKVKFYNNEGQLIAVADTNISNIAIQPNTATVVPNVLAIVYLTGVGGNIGSLLENTLNTEVEISILGINYTV